MSRSDLIQVYRRSLGEQFRADLVAAVLKSIETKLERTCRQIIVEEEAREAWCDHRHDYRAAAADVVGRRDAAI